MMFTDWTPEELPEKYRGKFEIADAGIGGIHSGRTRFRVKCNRCGQQLHEATTFPNHYIEHHACSVVAEGIS